MEIKILDCLNSETNGSEKSYQLLQTKPDDMSLTEEEIRQLVRRDGAFDDVSHNE